MSDNRETSWHSNRKVGGQNQWAEKLNVYFKRNEINENINIENSKLTCNAFMARFAIKLHLKFCPNNEASGILDSIIVKWLKRTETNCFS